MKRKKSHFTVTDKGQVTIPRDVRKQLGIEPGTQLEFEVRGEQVVMTKAFATAADRVRSVMGIAGRGLNTDRIIEHLRGKR